MTTINAYAAGRRSVAVTAGLVGAAQRGQVTAAQVAALLAHEIGHLRTGSTRYGLAVAWLTAPWRAAVTVVDGLLTLIIGRVPAARGAAVVLWPVVLAVTVLEAVRQHAWAPLSVLAAVGLMVSVHPLLDAALSRASERAADDYPIAVGAGPDLAAALGHLESNDVASLGRFRDGHPTQQARIASLAAAGKAP
jgi:Zn-dependent protease with chaperone function